MYACIYLCICTHHAAKVGCLTDSITKLDFSERAARPHTPLMAHRVKSQVLDCSSYLERGGVRFLFELLFFKEGVDAERFISLGVFTSVSGLGLPNIFAM
mmetsp:Transcript_85996/g.157438  ORF Transcript_85996/g.157438 Transcript_85996/m.157438 type:complete len:100 (-) Transcript_85996:1179-1478(-)